jgi:type I restriction enzyme S subunit
MEDIRNNGRILNKITASKFITKQAIKNNKLMPSDSFILSTTATIGEYALLTVDS